MPVLLILLGTALAVGAELPEMLKYQGARAQWAQCTGSTPKAPAAVVGGPVAVGRVPINTASAKELLELPGIGPKRVVQILEARESRPFKSAADLRRIKGLGPKRIRKLAPLLDYTLPHSASAQVNWNTRSR